MPQFRDFQVAVVIDGVELPEHSTQISDNEEAEISCYIPSEVGKNFAVKWRDLNRLRNTNGVVYLDGAKAGSKTIIKGRGPHEAKRSYYRVSRETVRPFCFTRLLLTDDENCVNPANGLGEVRLEIYQLLHFNHSPYPSDGKTYQVPGDVSIHERSKKAMAHRVGYGNGVRNIPRNLVTNIVNGKKLVTFIFRYRTLDMLQAQGIAPPPSQSAPSTKREKQRKRRKDDIVEVFDDGEADKARLKILKTEIDEIEERLSKRQKAVVKSECIEVIELD